MMSLDEAIDHAERQGISDAEGGKDHKQLAVWLREYKKMLEIHRPSNCVWFPENRDNEIVVGMPNCLNRDNVIDDTHIIKTWE